MHSVTLVLSVNLNVWNNGRINFVLFERTREKYANIFFKYAIDDVQRKIFILKKKNNALRNFKSLIINFLCT